MGLFSSGPDEEIQELIDNANGESVTADKLTEAETGRMAWDRLNDEPLRSYLEEGEQPHHILSQQQDLQLIIDDGENIEPDGKYRLMMTVTDQRVLFTLGGDSGDKSLSLWYDDVTGIDTRKNSRGDGSETVTLRIHTADKSYTHNFWTGTKVNIGKVASNGEEVDEAIDYIALEADINVGEADDAPKSKSEELIEEARAAAEGPTKQEANEHISDKSAEYVTSERVKKIAEVLDSDETVYYLTRGSTVDVEGSSAGSSLFGDNRSRKSGTSGWVRAAMTDKRVVVKVPQVLGNDERSVPYENITSVDLDTGLVNKRISLQTPGQTYHIESHDPGEKEVREAVKFIRNKITESNEETVVVEGSSEPDPTEQLKNLKELHEEGILTDEEFEEKKSDLLDKI